MELYAYVRKHEIQLCDFAKILRIGRTALRTYILRERTPTLETAYRIIKVTGGEVSIPDMLLINISPKDLRELNTEKMKKSRRWASVKLIQAACRDKSDKIYLKKKESINQKKMPNEWFIENQEVLDLL